MPAMPWSCRLCLAELEVERAQARAPTARAPTGRGPPQHQLPALPQGVGCEALRWCRRRQRSQRQPQQKHEVGRTPLPCDAMLTAHGQVPWIARCTAARHWRCVRNGWAGPAMRIDCGQERVRELEHELLQASVAEAPCDDHNPVLRRPVESCPHRQCKRAAPCSPPPRLGL